ncbi:MHC class II transactivator [Megalops cyprinoides]|uniref:MHC class II transactivator n=1 Tax=Megalops cyprinoides TaxID=118141 RepID=UPI001863AF9E|nr:MHC class II transactivator [Megalops cyprinoides]
MAWCIIPEGTSSLSSSSSSGSDMVPFEDILVQVRGTLEGASPGDVQSLLAELMEARVLSRDYCLSLTQEKDVEDLVRRISLPVWQNWEACHAAVGSALGRVQGRKASGSPLTGDLTDEERDCFSPSYHPLEDVDFCKIMDNLIQSLFDGHQGSSTGDAVAVPASPASSTEGENQEVQTDTPVRRKRGVSADTPCGDAKRTKSRSRAPTARRGPKTTKGRGRQSKRPQKSHCESTTAPETPAKRVLTFSASPGKVQISPNAVLVQHVPITPFGNGPIFAPAAGGSPVQVIQTFVPQQVISIPVSSTMVPGGPTYVLVPSPTLTASPQIMPHSPVAGTVVPPDLVVSTPVSSSSECADKALSPAPTQSPATEIPTCKESQSSIAVAPEPEKPKCVEDYIEICKAHMRDTFQITDTETGMTCQSLYVDVHLVQRQIQLKSGRNANKCLEKELVVLSDGDRRRATLSRGQVFEDAGQKPNRSIALLGRGGVGKTAMIQRLCLDWSNGDLPRFDFLFLLDCKALNLPQASFGLRTLLFDLSASPPCKDVDAVFRHVLFAPQKVLIVFDSFDDFKDYDGLLQSPATSNTKDSYSIKQLFSGLLQRKLLPGCTLLVAARPKEVLNQFLGKVDRIVEVCGFSPEDIETYVSRYFKCTSSQDRALKKLRNNGYVLSLCCNPLICRSACFLLEHMDCNKTLPSTLTGLYQEVMYHRLHMSGQKAQPTADQLRAVVPKLCSMAWAGVKSHNSLLTPKELGSGELKDFGVSSGVLAPHVLKDGKEQAGYGFAHLLNQNFLAASHLALSKDLSDKALVGQTTGQPKKRKLQAEWLDATHRFAVGLLFQKRALLQDCFPDGGGTNLLAKRSAVAAHLRGLKPCDLSSGKLLELCHCVYEAQDTKLARHLLKSMPDSLSFNGAQLDPPDVFVLWHLLLKAKTVKRTFSINLQETGINISGLKELLGLKCVTSFRASIGDTIRLWEDLHKVNAEGLLRNTMAKFTISPFKATQLSHVDDLALLVQICRDRTLPFSDPSCSEPVLDKDSLNIPAVRNLRRLDFELGPQNGPAGFSKLVTVLPDLRCLQHLDLEDNKIGDVGAKKLAEVVPALSSLEMLNLSQNCIGDEGVAKLAPALSSLPSLLRLSLYSNLIGDGGAENLAAVLPEMKSLTDLDVKYNKFTDSGAVKLSESVRDCPWMKSVGMWNHYIPHGVLERLKQQDCRIRTL